MTKNKAGTLSPPYYFISDSGKAFIRRISQPEELWNDGDTQSKKRCSVSYSSSG